MRCPNKLYHEIFQQATGCPAERTDEIYETICMIGGFTALDHLTSAQLIKAAVAAWAVIQDSEGSGARRLEQRR